MGIPIPGTSREHYDATKTESGSKPFPFLSGKWVNYTAEVVSVELSVDQSGKGNDQMVIKAANDGYECRIFISLDPNQVGPMCQNREKAIQGNIDRLLKAGKVLDVITWKGNSPEIEPKLFPKAKGRLISFGISGALDQYNRPKVNAKGYQQINTSLNGLAKVLEPVVLPAGYQAPAPRPSVPPPAAPSGAPSPLDYGSTDIPF